VLRAAVETSGVDGEDRAVEMHPDLEQPALAALADGDRQLDGRDVVDDARRVQRREQRGVVVELMPARLRRRDRMRQQDAPQIGGIAPALVDAGGEGDHRRAE
jgi:hypothetical protein